MDTSDYNALISQIVILKLEQSDQADLASVLWNQAISKRSVTENSTYTILLFTTFSQNIFKETRDSNVLQKSFNFYRRAVKCYADLCTGFHYLARHVYWTWLRGPAWRGPFWWIYARWTSIAIFRKQSSE